MRTFAAFCILLALGIGIAAQVKTPEPPAVKRPFAESLQAVVVTTPDWPTVKGTARLFERKTLRAKWTAVGDEFPIVVGRSGLGWAVESAPESASEFKKEGDGKAPAGLFPLTYAFGSAPKPEQLAYPYKKLESSTECVDEIGRAHV